VCGDVVTEAGMVESPGCTLEPCTTSISGGVCQCG
jgi:hypothetical protein